MQFPGIKEALDSFVPVSLEDMDNVRLMNRFDTKYALPVSKIPDFLTRLDGGYKVLEINNIRTFDYSTTYLDTSDFLFFNQHVIGKAERSKVRYRKYESTGITYLEVKRRTNKNRTIKWRIENEMTTDCRYDDKASKFINNYVTINSQALTPVLINSFKRATLTGSVINERITIDYGISFSDPEGNQANLPSLAVIELKRGVFNDRSPMAGLLKEYHIYPLSFSKYCIGLAMTHDLPRKNMLKQKFLFIKKIENEFNRCCYV